MRLAELQEAFARAVFSREDAAVAAMVAPGVTATAAQLSIYRVNVIENTAEALKDTFSAVCALVGADFFHQMARAFVREHPPRAACLLWYGGHLPDFLAAYAPAHSVPYLPDVARLEWAYHSARFAEDDEALDTAWLERQNEATLQRLRLHLRAGATVVECAFPARGIYAYALNPDASPMPEIEPKRERIALWRDEGEVKIMSLSAKEYAVLQEFSYGATVAAASQHAPELEAPQLLGRLFALHILRQPVTLSA